MSGRPDKTLSSAAVGVEFNTFVDAAIHHYMDYYHNEYATNQSLASRRYCCARSKYLLGS